LPSDKSKKTLPGLLPYQEVEGREDEKKRKTVRAERGTGGTSQKRKGGASLECASEAFNLEPVEGEHARLGIRLGEKSLLQKKTSANLGGNAAITFQAGKNRNPQAKGKKVQF